MKIEIEIKNKFINYYILYTETSLKDLVNLTCFIFFYKKLVPANVKKRMLCVYVWWVLLAGNRTCNIVGCIMHTK